MAVSKVYFSDFRIPYRSGGLYGKLQRVMRQAGIQTIDMEEKFVAIKMHFGELGNLAFLRPNYARAVVEEVKKLDGKPFLTDCNTMYPGMRKNALDHLQCAWLNGFTPITVGCPILIADGLRGLDDVEVPVVGGEYFKTAHIGRAIMDADIIISLTHFKGHEFAGFGGAIKNLGMGCGSRAGKAAQHTCNKPVISSALCRGCKSCMRECANGGLVFDEEKKKMTLNVDNCVGCARCLGACNFDAISFSQDNAPHELDCRMVEYAKAVCDGRPNFHISFVMDITPYCDCHRDNDTPILPNIGIFASFDPIALDQACADACLKATPMPNSMLTDNMKKVGFKDLGDPFSNTIPIIDWKSCLEHGEKIGLGTRDYELITLQ